MTPPLGSAPTHLAPCCETSARSSPQAACCTEKLDHPVPPSRRLGAPRGVSGCLGVHAVETLGGVGYYVLCSDNTLKIALLFPNNVLFICLPSRL